MRVAFRNQRSKKMSRVAKLLIIILFLLLNGTCFSQQWSATYSHNTSNDLISEDKAFSITVSNTGFVYVTGFCTSDSTGTDICTIKYDQLGDTVWTRIYTGGENSEDKAYAIVVDDLDNIIITGYTTNDNTGIDIITIKYSAAGDLIWTSVYNGTDSTNTDDKSQALCVDHEGNVYVTGYATFQDRGKDAIVIKYDSIGNLLWTYTYNYPQANSDDIANAIVLDNQGNVLITGSSMRGTTAGDDMLTVKINPSSGARIWSRVFNGSGSAEDKAYAITVDDLDYVIITGYTTNAAGYKDITTIKYYSMGYTYWTNTNDISGFDDFAKSIALTPDNGAVVTGSTKTGTADGTEDYITIKYSSAGAIEWFTTYSGGYGSDIAYSLVVSELDNAVYITGSSVSDSIPCSEDMFTIEYSLDSGYVLDTARLDGLAGGEDIAYDIAIDSAGNIYLTGYTEPLNIYDNQTHASDYLTAKYTGGNLLNRRSSIKTPEVFTLSQNYPNPFNPSTTIKFSIPNKGLAKLTVYDILGREVEVLVNQTLLRGDYSVKFNGDKLASGVYFYELSFNNYKDVKKMILIK